MDRVFEWVYRGATWYVAWWCRRWYRCARCRKLYRKAVTDAEAMKEAEANGFVHEGEPLAVVCDDCYKAILKAEGLEEVNRG